MTNGPLKALDAAIEIFGTQQKLSEALGRKNQSYVGEIRRRVMRGSVVPPEACLAIERATKGKVKRAALNPRVAW